MTENVTKYGCISKSLEKFLLCDSDEIRKKKYRPLKSAKYYERIVEGVKASFEDHFIVMNKLPEKYLKKINFEKHYKSVKSRKESKKILKKWNEQPLDKLIREIMDKLDLFNVKIGKYPELYNLVEPDYIKFLKWLTFIQKIEREGIKNLKDN